MKYTFFLTVLLVFNICSNQTAYAQTKVVKKNITTKDLNKLELENISTIPINKNQVRNDGLAKKDTIINIIYLSSNQINLDTNKKKLVDTTLHKISDNKQATHTFKHSSDSVIAKNIIEHTKQSTTIDIIDKNYRFADSIRKSNKPKLDSLIAKIPKKKPVIINKNDEIEIYVSGGGLYAGVNPKSYDVLMMFSNGYVNRKFITKLQGEQVIEKKISKDELRKLAAYIVNMGFFDYNKSYDCDRNDVACNTRLNSKPEPLSLTISVRIGERKMRTYVALFAPNLESNWVSYPTSLPKIIDAIYAVAAK